jgi:hypothetical protein
MRKRACKKNAGDSMATISPAWVTAQRQIDGLLTTAGDLDVVWRKGTARFNSMARAMASRKSFSGNSAGFGTAAPRETRFSRWVA